MCKNAYIFFRNQPKCLGCVTGQVEEICSSRFLDLLNIGALHIIVHPTVFRIILSKAICEFSAPAFQCN